MEVYTITHLNPDPMHKNTRLLPYQRREIYRRWKLGERVSPLSRQFLVSRETIYEVIRRAKLGSFENKKSINERYRNIYYGIRSLSDTEKVLAKKIAAKEHRLKRYEKQMPGEMVHFDTKRLPLLWGEAITQPREYIFVAIDDYSRWMYADIFPDKTSYSSAIFLEEVRRAMPFHIEKAYSDNGSEYKGKAGHPFADLLRKHGIAQGFTQVKHPWTNGKAERAIKTLMTEWCTKGRTFNGREERRKFLYAYVSWYNQVRSHQSLHGLSPLRRLEEYLARIQLPSVNNA